MPPFELRTNILTGFSRYGRNDELGDVMINCQLIDNYVINIYTLSDHLRVSALVPSLVPRPTLAVADGLHHRYARNGSGKQPNKSRSRHFRANSDVMGVRFINGVS